LTHEQAWPTQQRSSYAALWPKWTQRHGKGSKPRERSNGRCGRASTGSMQPARASRKTHHNRSGQAARSARGLKLGREQEPRQLLNANCACTVDAGSAQTSPVISQHASSPGVMQQNAEREREDMTGRVFDIPGFVVAIALRSMSERCLRFALTSPMGQQEQRRLTFVFALSRARWPPA
jgi:hypothetical protein